MSLSLSFNQNQLSSSLMTINTYFDTFIRSKDRELTNDWGWFVDIEKNVTTYRSKYDIRPSRHLAIPKTVIENKSMRSFKSMRNLHNDSEMIFKMDEDIQKEEEKISHSQVLLHTACLIGLVMIYISIV